MIKIIDSDGMAKIRAMLDAHDNLRDAILLAVEPVEGESKWFLVKSFSGFYFLFTPFPRISSRDSYYHELDKIEPLDRTEAQELFLRSAQQVSFYLAFGEMYGFGRSYRARQNYPPAC